MVATAGGVLLAVCGWVALVAGLIWGATFLLSRYTSVASIVSVVSLPALSVVFGYPWPVVAFTTFAAAAVVFLHRGNLRRLRAGTENRFHLRRPARA
jgi:glycerol-3-phosphate acyltransferase PlsY